MVVRNRVGYGIRYLRFVVDCYWSEKGREDGVVVMKWNAWIERGGFSSVAVFWMFWIF